MAPKKSHKPLQGTMVEKPTQDPEVPLEFVGKEHEDSEDREVQMEQDDHGNEEEQISTVLFTQEQLEVLFKMNKPDFSELVWMPYISRLHNDDPSWHIFAYSILLNKSHGLVELFMVVIDLNK
jgi:hypothetical protein